MLTAFCPIYGETWSRVTWYPGSLPFVVVARQVYPGVELEYELGIGNNFSILADACILSDTNDQLGLLGNLGIRAYTGGNTGIDSYGFFAGLLPLYQGIFLGDRDNIGYKPSVATDLGVVYRWGNFGFGLYGLLKLFTWGETLGERPFNFISDFHTGLKLFWFIGDESY